MFQLKGSLTEVITLGFYWCVRCGLTWTRFTMSIVLKQFKMRLKVTTWSGKWKSPFNDVQELHLTRGFLSEHHRVSLLVCSGHYNKTVPADSVLWATDLFLTVTEAGKYTIKATAYEILMGVLFFWFIEGAFLLCLYMVKGESLS